MSNIGTYNLLQSFNLLVNQGAIQGHSVVDKFGETPVITTSTDPADIWEGGQFAGAEIYTFSADGVADIDTLSSSSTSDVGQPIKIGGLLADGTEQDGYAVTNGQNKVLIYDNPGLTGDPISFWRVFRMENESDATDTQPNLVGVLYCYVDGAISLGVPTDITTVRAIIDDGNNQTLMSIYTIPKGKVGFLYEGELGVSRPGGGSAEAKFSYRSRRFGKIFKIKKRIATTTTGSTVYQDSRGFPDPIPAKTDIVLRCDEVSATIGVFGTFCILLIDEDLLGQNYLTAIGQPE